MALDQLIRKGKSFSRRAITTALIIASSGVLNTCGSDKPTGPKPPEFKDFKPAENTYVLNSESMEALSSYQNGTLRFEAVASQVSLLEQGDILIGLPSDATPLGFLRKVSSISPDKKTISTTQSNLEEAVESAHIRISKRLTPSDLAGFSSQYNLSKPSSAALFDFNFPLVNIVLYDADGNPATRHDQVVANGNLSFNADFDFGLDLGFLRIDSLSVSTKSTESLNLELISGPTFEIEKEVTLAELWFNPVYVPGTPFFVTPKIELHVGIDGRATANFKTSVIQEAQIRSGIHYKRNSGWSKNSAFSNFFDFQEPQVSANMLAKGFVGVDLDLFVYGIAGASGEVNGYLKLDAAIARNPWWKLFGGLEASLGAEAEIFSASLTGFKAQIASYEKLLAESSGERLKASLTTTPSSGELPLEVLLDASASTPREIIKEYIFAFGDGLPNYRELSTNAPDGAFDGKTTHIYQNKGEYVPSVTVGDRLGGLAFAKDTITVTEKSLEGKIVFTSIRSGDADIFLINQDGTGEKNLTNDASWWNSNPSWSPNASRIVFESRKPFVGYMIEIIDPNGANKVSFDLNGSYPVFSPDGGKIAYLLNEEFSIYIMDSNGSNPRRVIGTLVGEGVNQFGGISWHPNGRSLAFSSTRSGDGNVEIYTIDTSGIGLRRLTNSDPYIYDDNPIYSPDGAGIAFSSNRTGDFEIYVMNADGSNVRNISNSSATRDTHPSWSSNGNFIVYASYSGPSSYKNELWVMNSEGSNKRAITNNNYDDKEPSWSR